MSANLHVRAHANAKSNCDCVHDALPLRIERCALVTSAVTANANGHSDGDANANASAVSSAQTAGAQACRGTMAKPQLQTTQPSLELVLALTPDALVPLPCSTTTNAAHVNVSTTAMISDSANPGSGIPDQKQLRNIVAQLQERDPKLAPMFRAVGALKLEALRKPPYVAMVGALVGQIIAYKAARTTRGKLYTLLGGTDFTLQQVEAVSDAQLLSTGLSPRALAVLRAANRYICERGLTLQSESQILQLARDVPGIGAWTVQNMLLVTMINLDVMPSNDVFINRRLCKLYGWPAGKRPTAQQVEQVSRAWAPYRGIVCWHLWRYF